MLFHSFAAFFCAFFLENSVVNPILRRSHFQVRSSWLLSSFLSRKPDFVSQCLGYPHGPDQVCWQFLTTAFFLENLFAISDIPNLASRPDPVGYHQFSISKAWFCISMFRIPAQARSSQLAVLCAAFFLENLFAISDIPNLASRPDPVSCLVNLYDSAHKAYWTVFFLESLFVNSILRKLHL
jgi:hypothetical protein